jgi:hypothetical protein
MIVIVMMIMVMVIKVTILNCRTIIINVCVNSEKMIIERYINDDDNDKNDDHNKIIITVIS